MYMTSKVTENKKNKENKILNAAIQLFTKEDIHSVTISQIAKKAGVAKGTFYLYFRDKYEIRDILIHRESRKIFLRSHKKMLSAKLDTFEDNIIFLVNDILDTLESNPIELKFIERNLSWGLFSSHVQHAIDDDEINIVKLFTDNAIAYGYEFENPTVILYMIIELVGSCCYNSILFNQPLSIHDFKPYLFDSIRAILRQNNIKKDLHS